MNYKMVFHTIGNLLKVEAGLLGIPFLISIYYHESILWAYLIPIVLLLIIGFLLTFNRNFSRTIYAKEGFAIVALSWIIMSLFGALPFILSGAIPNFINALFETVSGFTTTGASILSNVEEQLGSFPSLLFWRSFTHWIGGMGVLVFILAVLPHTDARSMNIMKAESPGPQVGKLVSKVKFTARILYSIYVFMTIIQIILLSFDMPLYDSIVNSLATAGTGGFSIKNNSIAFYDSLYAEVVITVFMILFGINFNVFYLLLLGNIKSALKSEELRWFLGIIGVAILLISLNIFLSGYYTFGQSFRHSAFQVASIITTTGFSTADFNLWPAFSKVILLILMMIGACAGSTGGGMKVSRFVISIKQIVKEIKYSLHPKQVLTISFENKPLEQSVTKGISSYMIAYGFIMFFGFLAISIFDNKDLLSNFTAVITTMNNVGPGLEIVGPMGNFSSYSLASKIIFSMLMITGRLEIFPILGLFSIKMWKKQ